MWNINDGPVTRYGHCPPSHHFRGWGGRTETNITFPQSENLRSFETLLEPFAFNNKHSFLSIWDDLRMTSKCSDLLIKCGINGNISWLYLSSSKYAACFSVQQRADIQWHGRAVRSDCHDQPSSFSRVATLRGDGDGVIQTLVKCTMRLIQI